MALKNCKPKKNDSPFFYQHTMAEKHWQDLVQEAVDAKPLLENMNQELNNPDCKFVYVISSRWLREWKEYTSYDNIVHGKQPDEDYFGRYTPSKINKDIVLENYYVTKYPDKKDYRNVFVREGILENIDYQIITEAVWKYFAKRYEGIEVKRPVHVLFNNAKFIEVALKQVQIVPITNLHLRDIDHKRVNKFIAYPIQVLAYNTISDLNDDLETIFDPILNPHLFSSNYTSDQHVNSNPKGNLHLFLMNPALDLTSVFQYLREVCSGYRSFQYRIEFPGQFIGKDSFMKLIKTEISEQDLIFVDLPLSTLHWALYGGDLYPSGKCWHCHTYQELKVICGCKQGFYCSEKCRKADLERHIYECRP